MSERVESRLPYPLEEHLRRTAGEILLADPTRHYCLDVLSRRIVKFQRELAEQVRGGSIVVEQYEKYGGSCGACVEMEKDIEFY